MRRSAPAVEDFIIARKSAGQISGVATPWPAVISSILRFHACDFYRGFAGFFHCNSAAHPERFGQGHPFRYIVVGNGSCKLCRVPDCRQIYGFLIPGNPVRNFHAAYGKASRHREYSAAQRLCSRCRLVTSLHLAICQYRILQHNRRHDYLCTKYHVLRYIRISIPRYRSRVSISSALCAVGIFCAPAYGEPSDKSCIRRHFHLGNADQRLDLFRRILLCGRHGLRCRDRGIDRHSLRPDNLHKAGF